MSSSFRIAACFLTVSLLSLAWCFQTTRPKEWKPGEVPVAFWSWRAEAPDQSVVERAMQETHAHLLFLHAGQIDYTSRTLQRIRSLKGPFPCGATVHLVYNGTRSLLANFERLDPETMASIISDTYGEDVARARSDRSQVAGLQLDFDVPTRLLPLYAQILRRVRGHLAPQVKLSVTGLPTWIDSPQIKDVLEAADFWTPQCYGATIPDQLQKVIPIASAPSIRRTIARLRQLGYPFYAGLPAYGEALLYSPEGALINLRGDLDPARVARDPNFELIERRPYEAPTPGDDPSHCASEWRYVYRALNEGVLEGLAFRTGDYLVLDVPSAASLRAYVRAVREEAGSKLLGICIFRLPSHDDTTTLTLGEIAAALMDVTASTEANVRIDRVNERAGGGANCASCLNITAINSGTASALIGSDALTLTMRVPAGSVRGVSSLDGFTSFETLCEISETSAPHRCGLPRANVIRLKAQTLTPGATAQARIVVQDEMPKALDTIVTMRIEDGRTYQNEGSISITTGDHR